MDSTERFASGCNFAVLLTRVSLALVFLLALSFKAMSIGMVAAMLAAVFELALVVSPLTGVYFSQLMLAGFVYVMFLAFAFHGPSHWTDPKGLSSAPSSATFPLTRRCSLRQHMDRGAAS